MIKEGDDNKGKQLTERLGKETMRVLLKSFHGNCAYATLKTSIRGCIAEVRKMYDFNVLPNY